MKRTIIATILGVAASAALVSSSQAQGIVVFANYAGDNGGVFNQK